MGGMYSRCHRLAFLSSLPAVMAGGLALLGVARAEETNSAPLRLTLDGQQRGRVFEGIGACSAGASSRLLIDYPEPARSQILDFLFKPKFGAGFQHLKVEIGGDVNSTDGCEPSHQHDRKDENYQRGYEWWLMKEARRRNPAVFLDCLEWGAPAWIGEGNFYSKDNAEYISRFLAGARRHHGLDIEFVGIWNETRPDLGWIKLLRSTLDARGLQGVKIVADDNINRWSIVDLMQNDPALARAVHAVGIHYPKAQSSAAAKACGKPIWSSEDGPWKENWEGACTLAKAYNRNYVEGRMTKTVIWSPVTSYYDILPLPGSGVLHANTPWSGHFAPRPALWATAHTTQFAEPGWTYLEGDACRLLPGGGSLVTLVAPNGRDFSVIAETIDAKAPQTVVLQMGGGLADGPLHVWRTQAGAWFVPQPDLLPREQVVTLVLEPGSIYSLTTTIGQTKGAVEAPPVRPFPLPYREDFEAATRGGTPRYFSDQAGGFEVVKAAKRQGQALRQVVRRKGIEWHFHWNPPPETFLGDATWSNYEVGVDAYLEGDGNVSLFGRVGKVNQNENPPEGYWLKVDQWGYWELGTAEIALASGSCGFKPKEWHRLGLRMADSVITVLYDGRALCSVTNSQYLAGMVGLGCGWHAAQFDNLTIEPGPGNANLALGRPARASSTYGPDFAPENVTDGDGNTTRWSAAAGKTVGEWLQIDLGTPTKVSSLLIRPFEDRIREYVIQCDHGSGWRDVHRGGRLGAAPTIISFPEITASSLRLLVTEATAEPSLWEIVVRGP